MNMQNAIESLRLSNATKQLDLVGGNADDLLFVLQQANLFNQNRLTMIIELVNGLNQDTTNDKNIILNQIESILDNNFEIDKL